MNFDQAFERLLGHEGGYSNDPRDPGGETNWGISRRSYPYVDIAKLTQEGAKAIYLKDFWQAVRADELPAEVRFAVFDAAVNSGVSQAIRWLQFAVGTGLDGKLGPATMAACKALPGAVVAARYSGRRLLFMTDLQTWSTFGKGWARRIAKNLLEL